VLEHGVDVGLIKRFFEHEHARRRRRSAAVFPTALAISTILTSGFCRLIAIKVSTPLRPGMLASRNTMLKLPRRNLASVAPLSTAS
jgi:hypothetical protein